MSAQIIQLPRKPVARKLPDSPVWFCIKCGGEEFCLYETGDIFCNACHSRIKNLTVDRR